MKKFLKNFKCAVSNTPVTFNFGIQKSVTQNFNFCSRFRSDLPLKIDEKL
nr:MAG TPA: hypothetical protein [Bacteriophage sp.]